MKTYLETNAGTEDVRQRGTLLGERVDDRGARRSKRRLLKLEEDSQI